jgi:hypothetical protein
MTTTLGPPPAVTATPPGSAFSRTWRTIAIFLPSPIREASKQGLLRTLVYLMLAITVFPLLVAFLAAFWLSTIKHHVSADFVQSLRNSYVAVIQEGFSFDELVARKLDYMQSIALHLQPKALPANIPIYLEVRQHARVTLTEVLPLPSKTESGENCYQNIDPHTPLVTVSLGPLLVLQCQTIANGTCSRTLDEAWWRDNGAKLPQDTDSLPLLTIARADVVAQACVEVEVEGRVMVYKTVYP